MGIRKVAGLAWNRLLMRVDNSTSKNPWNYQKRTSYNLFSRIRFWVACTLHPLGCGWHHLQAKLTLWSLSRNWVLILKELRSLPPSSMCTLCLQAPCALWCCPYQTFLFQYCYQLSSGAGFRPSLQPSWSPLIFPPFRGGGALRYSVPKWLLFLN